MYIDIRIIHDRERDYSDICYIVICKLSYCEEQIKFDNYLMQRITGVILTIVSAVCFGTLAIIGRIAYASGIDTFTLLFLRFTAAAVFMAMLMILLREKLPHGKGLMKLIGMGAIGYVAQSFFFLSAIKYASAGLVALLLYLYPVFVAILSVIFLKEKLTRVKVIALVVALLGTTLTVDPQGGQLIGILLAIGSAVIYSVYIIVGAGVMKGTTGVQSSTVIFASSAFVYCLLAGLNGPEWPGSQVGWWAIAGLVLVSTVIPVVTFLEGMKRIGPTNASLLSTLEPVVTVFLAALLFEESLPPQAFLGGVLILVAVVLVGQN